MSDISRKVTRQRFRTIAFDGHAIEFRRAELLRIVDVVDGLEGTPDFEISVIGGPTITDKESLALRGELLDGTVLSGSWVVASHDSGGAGGPTTTVLRPAGPISVS